MTRTSRCSRRKTESCRVMRGARALFIEYISECAPKKAAWFLVGCDGYARYSKMRQAKKGRAMLAPTKNVACKSRWYHVFCVLELRLKDFLFAKNKFI